jgi:ABC-type amino acid transport substrate-binding protein
MLITDARKEVIDFSDPVFPYPEGMVVSADDARRTRGSPISRCDRSVRKWEPYTSIS